MLPTHGFQQQALSLAQEQLLTTSGLGNLGKRGTTRQLALRRVFEHKQTIWKSILGMSMQLAAALAETLRRQANNREMSARQF